MKQKNNDLLSICMLWICTLALSNSHALELPHILSDGAVFQRGKPIRLWGSSQPGATVTALVNQKATLVVADDKGEWFLEVDPPKELRDDIIIRSSTGIEKRIKKPLLGQVWLCGGQSNMAMPLVNTDGYPTFAQSNAENELIVRLYRAPGGKFGLPEEQWLTNDTENIRNFSAICYMTGHAVAKERNEVVGLIDLSVGGTRLEAWMPSKAPRQQTFSRSERNQKGFSFDTVVAPQKPYSARGLIWYQGEWDTNHQPERYSKLLVQTMKDWRNAWNDSTLQITVIQLPQFSGAKSQKNWRTLQEQQEIAAKTLQGASIVRTSDLIFNKIHPLAKREISRRTAHQIQKDQEVFSTE